MRFAYVVYEEVEGNKIIYQVLRASFPKERAAWGDEAIYRKLLLDRRAFLEKISLTSELHADRFDFAIRSQSIDVCTKEEFEQVKAKTPLHELISFDDFYRKDSEGTL